MHETVSSRVLEGSRKYWEAFHSHPFVSGIANGSLPSEKFVHFMVQDYLYLLEYAKVFSVGMAKTSDLEVMKAFSAYVSSILSGEMDIHRGYMERLGIDLADVEKTSLSQDNLSYTSYMLRIAYEAGPAEILAAILPCAVSYEEIARKMVEEDPSCADHPFYGEWIRGYASPFYHEENLELEALLDKVAADAGEAQIQRLIEIGQRCSRYEGAFWDMAWELRR